MPMPIVVKRALLKAQGKKRDSPAKIHESIPEPGTLICACRYHGPSDRYIDTTNHVQAVCQACRDWWEQSRTETISGDNAISERRGAVHTILRLAENADPDVEVSSPSRRKRSAPEELPRERKKLCKRTMQLPREILSMILSKAMDLTPRCALDLLLPDWNVCNESNSWLEKLLQLTRIITYTKGNDHEVGSLVVRNDHDHHSDRYLFLPRKSMKEQIMRLNKWCYDEVTKLVFLGSVQVFHLAADKFPNEVENQSFVETWRDIYPIRGSRARDILPFDDEDSESSKRKTPDGETYILELIRHIVIHSPLTLLMVDAHGMVDPVHHHVSEVNLHLLDMAIDLDRSSPLWVSWSQMPRLQSVLLDLRIYSHVFNTEHGCLGKAEILDRAREMASWLQLDLLVLAGLQSYSFATSYDSYTAERIETDDEIDGQPNWIKIFRPALRPGGKIVLVDHLADLVENLPGTFTPETYEFYS
ncbi:hypothetical protein F5Y04DRAFT_214271 [Hypomontagnella monticulosa]|nr:hypothetical protein F5Y04DRAFT_214271 [Hypomontagnella monticulosa]